MLEKHFGLSANNTSVRTEVLAGVTTFLTMAYIIFVNPAILANAGMDKNAVFVATCLAAAIASVMMGVIANYPIALAPGMGLNAYFAFTVAPKFGWEAALGAVFVSGVIFFILSVLPVREWIINAIPKSLKLAISAGIGLFLGIIGLQACGFVVDHPATLVTHGDFTKWPVILAGVGFAIMIALDHYKVPGGLIIGVLAVTVIAMLLGLQKFGGIASAPPSIAPVFLKLDIGAALSIGLVTVVFAFLFVDLFDNSGTLIGIAHRAGFLRPDGTVPRLGQALTVDSSAAMIGAALGTSTTTSYIESAAGIKAGGRTGLTAVVVGILFVLALFFAPLAGSVPAFATAPALIYVACLMAKGLTEIDWEDATEYAPAVLTALTMPFTYSIADGIAVGFIAYAVIKVASGRAREVSPVIAILAVLFVLKYAFV
ncbi:MAG: NCS2 family permease [Alphaproteobacteria bacterium]|nr:NCS2 family permease [Alphaproteobacteria bacterium]